MMIKKSKKEKQVTNSQSHCVTNVIRKRIKKIFLYFKFQINF